MNLKLFEIPVYSMDKSKYNAYYIDYLKKQINGKTEKLDEIKQIFFPKDVWEYNQVIGCIQILADTLRNDISFEVYKHNHKVYPICKERNYLRREILNGMHFRYCDLSNKEIVNKIRTFIQVIHKDLFNNRYLDMESFNNIVGYIDFHSLTEENHGQAEIAQ